MSVMQGISSSSLKGDVTQTTKEQQVISEIGEKVVPTTYAQDPPAISPAEQARIDAEAEAKVKAEAKARSAQGATAKLQETLTGAANMIAKLAVFLLKVIGALLMFMLYWMGDLMDNTFILDGSMGDKLQIIWMFIRNIVNVGFAIILVVVAFINVAGYGAGEGNYALKKFLPKMAIALIAINFTFLGARVVLDVNNVLTTAVFSLPQNVPDLGQYTAESQKPLKMYAKYKCSFNKTETAEWVKGLEGENVTNLGTEGGDTGLYQQGLPVGSFFDVCVADISESETLGKKNKKDNIGDDGLIEVGNLKQLSSRNFVWVMATRFQGIQNIAKVPLEAKDWESLLMNANFALLFGIIYAIAYLAMFIILIIRVIVLWICIALSPLIALEILFPELMSGLKMGDEDLKTMFLNHAFVPLKMAIPMSIGFVMVSQMSLVGLGNFSKEILLTGGEFTRGGSVHRILYGVASVAFLWIGVFAATDKVKGKSVIEKIKGGTENVGKFLAKTPLQTLPLVPVAGKMIPLSAAHSLWKTIEQEPKRHAATLGRESADLILGTERGKKIRATRALEDLQGNASVQNVRNIHEHWDNLETAQKAQAMRLMMAGGGAATQMGDSETLKQFVDSNKRDDAHARLKTEFSLSDDQIKKLFGEEEAAETAGVAGETHSAIDQMGLNISGNVQIDGKDVSGKEPIQTALKAISSNSTLISTLTSGALLTHLLANPAELEKFKNTAIANDLADAVIERIGAMEADDRPSNLNTIADQLVGLRGGTANRRSIIAEITPSTPPAGDAT
jgi:hypothetical protein